MLDLRRISALLLCELAYRNNEIKKKIAVMLKMYPAEGRVSIIVSRFVLEGFLTWSLDFHML